MLLSDPAILAGCALAVILVGMAKGGFSGLGALGTPVAALVLPPSVAAAILLPVLIVQDVVSVRTPAIKGAIHRTVAPD